MAETTFSKAIEEQLDFLMHGADYGDAKLGRAMRLELGERLKEGRPLRVYLGVDPTAPNIHLGHGVVLHALARFQQLGHEITFLIGDFTALIGDPTGRSKTRPPLTPDEVRANAKTYTDQAFHVLDRARTRVEYNSTWLGAMSFADVVKLTSSMTLAQVLVREDFGARHAAGSPIHLHEFLYALMQGEDAVRLRTDVQLGGRDQLFNILTGRDVMRHQGLAAQVALTMPILPGTDGKLKMSKSYGNDIGVTIAPSDMYGKVMSIPDEAMPDYWRLASGAPPAEAEELVAGVAADRIPAYDAKRRLARCIVARWHGEAAAAEAEAAFAAQFSRHEVPSDIPELAVPAEARRVLDLVHAAAGGSRSEAQRLVEGGGVHLDGETLPDWKAPLPEGLGGRVLKVGKRRWFRLRAP